MCSVVSGGEPPGWNRRSDPHRHRMSWPPAKPRGPEIVSVSRLTRLDHCVANAIPSFKLSTDHQCRQEKDFSPPISHNPLLSSRIVSTRPVFWDLFPSLCPVGTQELASQAKRHDLQSTRGKSEVTKSPGKQKGQGTSVSVSPLASWCFDVSTPAGARPLTQSAPELSHWYPLGGRCL
jgi:hypothetical protein